MKQRNFLKLSSLLLGLFLLVYVACTVSEPLLVQSGIPDAEKIVADYNAGKLLPEEKAEYYKGSATLDVGSEMIAFSLEGAKEGKFLHYVLQPKSENYDIILKALKNRDFSEIEMIFFHRTIVVASLKDEFKFIYSLDDTKMSSLSSIAFGSEFLNEMGLIKHLTPKPEIIFRGEGGEGGGQELSCACCVTGISSTACNNVASESCDAGGTGATGCSLSVGGNSCTVQCSGSTACCWD